MEPSTSEHLLSCPICGGASFRRAIELEDHSISHERFFLADCEDCGFRVTDPRPTPALIGSYYESDAYISHSNARRTLQDRLYQLARKITVRKKHALIARTHATGSVLDIGCGTGEFLGHLQRVGYLAQGVEPNALAREQAILSHRLTVLPSLDDVHRDRPFDIITLWHVLEHFHHPEQALANINDLLGMGGRLFIAVPNRESWDCLHYGPEWAAWDVPRHLSHFRSSDMEKLLAHCGLRIEEQHPMWFDALYVSLLSERYRGRARGRALIQGIFSGMRSNWSGLVGGRPASSTIYVAKRSN